LEGESSICAIPDGQVQEKFMLDLSEEDAIKQFEVLLNDTSYLTVVFDRIHDWAQYLRD
jgi:phosphatidylinositol 3-kinase